MIYKDTYNKKFMYSMIG